MGKKKPVYIFDECDRPVQITPETARKIDDMAREKRYKNKQQEMSRLDALLDRTQEEKDLIRWKELHELFQKDYRALNKKEMRQMMFMPDGKTPRCQHCGHGMYNYVPKTGRFKGQLQRYSWVCSCSAFRKLGIVISVG